MLHPSLIDLAEQAPLSSTAATARGVLAESQDLLRNAIDHREPESELSAWYSKIIADTLQSPAARDLVGDSRILPTGGIGRGDGLPTDPVSWFAIGPTPNADRCLLPLFEGSRLSVAPAGSASLEDWRDRGLKALEDGDAGTVAILADAGLLTRPGQVPALLERAITHRPPALQVFEGLPDRNVLIDMQATLLSPVSDVARWVGLAVGASSRTTTGRLSEGQDSGLLSPAETESLIQVWETGVTLHLRRWRDDLHEHPVTTEDLPALDRTAHGAAARMAAGVLRSLAARFGIPLAEQ
ncbi:putative nucleotidyltransferase substrate binding domain-containing protein [Corynebacterium alimapuense]|uniref:putative nucleotidyltransferase substrate binding domain-containing protein n=1 Tax=Corynebacterium alimapuense TaxID=1576874 RepID=UPI001403728C|nr:putative nucleotidyltransferase substrate binding domain-containing protein [Corynebacterium alimapuense]